jgi:hypothetical protein
MKKIIILLSLITQITCFSQKNYVKGYVVLNSNDTLKGLIDNKEWIRSPTSILFSSNAYKDAEMNIENIIAFGIDESNENYVLKRFEIEKLKRDFNRTQFGTASKYANRIKVTESKLSFLRMLSKGNLDLFQFIDQDLEEHYLIESQNTLIPLIYHEFLMDGKRQQFEQYKSQLQNLLVGSCIDKNAINEINYKISSISKLVNSHNNCYKKNQEKYISKIDKGKFHFGLLGGISHSQYLLKDKMKTLARADGGVSPIIGIYLNYVFPRNNGKTGFIAEFHNYKIKSESYSDNFLTVKTLLQYKIKTEKPLIYLIGGFGFKASKKNSEGLAEQGLVLGGGLGLKNLSIETRGTFNNIFNAYYAQNYQTRYFDLLLRLNLK